jgi:hypothetical protein
MSNFLSIVPKSPNLPYIPFNFPSSCAFRRLCNILFFILYSWFTFFTSDKRDNNIWTSFPFSSAFLDFSNFNVCCSFFVFSNFSFVFCNVDFMFFFSWFSFLNFSNFSVNVFFVLIYFLFFLIINLLLMYFVQL